MKIQLTLLPDSVRRKFKTVEYCPERHLRSMLSNVASALVALAMTIALNDPLLAATTTAPLVQKADLVYQGAFRVPQGTNDKDTFNYGGTSLAFNPANNSLFMVGHVWNQLSAEIKIPSIVNTTNINSLATATIVQSFKDATEGKLSSINPSDPNSKKVGGQLVYNGKLYTAAYSYYDGAVTQTTSHFVRPINLSTTGQVKGPYKVGSQYPGFVSGYMTQIPSEWQSLLGGPALTGNCCLAIVSAQSSGPAASVFDPNNAGSVNPVPAIPVVGYPYAHPLGDWGTGNPYFNGTTQITGIVFPNGTRSVLFFGRHGTGAFCYGTGAECNDPADSSKGTHAYPYKYQVWAYDANDLLSAKNGAKQQYDVKPYAVWNFSLPFEGASGGHLIGGAAYDPATNNIYVSQGCVDSNCAPIVHVFKSQGGATPSTLLPPSNLHVQ
jgi:hypothetical protein